MSMDDCVKDIVVSMFSGLNTYSDHRASTICFAINEIIRQNQIRSDYINDKRKGLKMAFRYKDQWSDAYVGLLKGEYWVGYDSQHSMTYVFRFNGSNIAYGPMTGSIVEAWDECDYNAAYNFYEINGQNLVNFTKWSQVEPIY